jgi:acetyltransferase-like isoleucine patch superfamily enzyme
MKLKYYIQKLLGCLLDRPIIPKGKTCGYSLVKSERASSTIADNSRVYPPFFLHGVEVGVCSYVAKNSNINNCSIGKFCSIGPNFCCGLGIHLTNGISTAPMFYSPSKVNGTALVTSPKAEESKQTTIGNDVFIGANVTVLDGVTIGDGAVIGAGAVVSKDIPPYAVAVGCPIRIVKYRMTEQQISAMLRIQWWNWDVDRLQEVERMFENIDGFIDKYDVK